MQMLWPGNRFDDRRVLSTDVAKDEIVKARALHWVDKYPGMKKLTLLGAGNSVLGDVEAMNNGEEVKEVDVPRGHNLVGLYGRFFAGQPSTTAIISMGLIMYKK